MNALKDRARARAGIGYTLARATDEGHCGLPASTLRETAARLLEIPQPIVDEALDLELGDVRPFRAAVRLISRPAPWQTLPNVSTIAPSAPTRTQEAVPMLPGISTGWPMLR